MRRFFSFRSLFALVTALLVGYGAGYAAQVAATAYLKAGSYYGRSDGLYQDTTSKGLVAVSNGKSAQFIGPTFYEDFTQWGASKGMSCLIASSGVTCAGITTTVPGLLAFGDGLKLIAFPIGTSTIPPVMTAKGLDITGDLTADEGFEIVSGELGATGRPFIIGADPAFYFCATVYIADVSGTDDFHVGFRRSEAFTATFDNYNDLASIGNISGNVYIETILNNAATTSTDTGDDWADGETHKLCVYVSAAGVVTYTNNGLAPTTTAAFTFDSGDPVIPFVHLLQDTDIAETTTITKWEVAYQ